MSYKRRLDIYYSARHIYLGRSPTARVSFFFPSERRDLQWEKTGTQVRGDNKTSNRAARPIYLFGQFPDSMARHILFGSTYLFGQIPNSTDRPIYLGRSLTARVSFYLGRSLLNGLTYFIRRQISTKLSQQCRTNAEKIYLADPQTTPELPNLHHAEQIVQTPKSSPQTFLRW
jgi:hypothetical protein